MTVLSIIAWRLVLSFLGTLLGVLILYVHIIHKPTQLPDVEFRLENISVVNISYNVQGENRDNRQVLVVPRRAYYDNRIVKGKPRTIVVILSEVEDNTVKDIVACEINGYYSKSVNIIKDDVSWVRWHKKGYTHCSVTVQCLGLPEAAILNGSTTHVIYKKKAESFYSRVETEKPLLITSPAVRSGSVLMCATLFGHPRNLDAWLKYQKTIGVDLVRLNVHPSFSQNATHITPYLKEAIDSGFVLMETWNDIVGERFYYYGQQVKNQDCVYRYMNTYEYALFLDHDDFFNPLIPHHKGVHYYTLVNCLLIKKLEDLVCVSRGSRWSVHQNQRHLALYPMEI